MAAPDQNPEAILRGLCATGRQAKAVVLVSVCVLAACTLHALTEGPRLDPSLALVHRLRLSDLALVAHEDLRHPGWGRPEQARAGQPSLPDPRGVRALVAPRPMQVVP